MSLPLDSIGSPVPTRNLRLPLLFSLLLHLLAGLLLTGGRPQAESAPELRLRMVRLVGGGEGRPGWVDPAASREIARKVQPPRSEPPSERETVPPAPAPARERPAVERKSDPVPVSPARQRERPGDRHEESSTGGIAEEKTVPDRRGESPGAESAGAAAGEAGPRGSGRGAVADREGSPGLEAYLLRIEGAVQRAFRYPARHSGRAAVFHFYVEAGGAVAELVQRESSGLPGLDLAGRGAIERSRLPPLPPAFPYERLGVTFTFVDE